LLDAKLKYIVPPVVDAFIEYLQRPAKRKSSAGAIGLQSAVCTLLYTFSKVRGYKVIVGFFNNEARYLEPVLEALERAADDADEPSASWQTHYILLLWLSHLLLTPFDLASISSKAQSSVVSTLDLPHDLTPVASRCLRIGLHYLSSPSKAQDAAAKMLARLVARPDMKLQLARELVRYALGTLESEAFATTSSVYQLLGSLRLVASVSACADLAPLLPSIYKSCFVLAEDQTSQVATNAIAKKLVIKVIRSIVILALHSSEAEGPMSNLLHTDGLLEDAIDYMLRSLGDKDTQVRHAAAKALSAIIQELEPGMGHEIIQAVLDMFKQDLPRNTASLDFRNADPLKWHGLTLALAHSLFKRTASPEQLPDIINALVAALQFDQRTTTGSSLGTNVRDAANFGIWSLSRRYTTDELLTVNTTEVGDAVLSHSVIQYVAVQLILSASLDPAGNVRRGSSAALQELVGRHPNQVFEGISLVQIVDYQAVGLRNRALVLVGCKTAELYHMYWKALIDGVLGWRGVGSQDVASREASATSLAKLSKLHGAVAQGHVARQVLQKAANGDQADVEMLHGLVLALACIVEEQAVVDQGALWRLTEELAKHLVKFSPRIVRAELPAATARFLAAMCWNHLGHTSDDTGVSTMTHAIVEQLAERCLAGREEALLQVMPSMAQAVLAIKRSEGQPLGCVGAQVLAEQVGTESTKSTLNGIARAVALGALAPKYGSGLSGEKAISALRTLVAIQDAMNVEWRVIGIRALEVAIRASEESISPKAIEVIAAAVHRGLNDYTIDERGDVGSLVRLQSISCTARLLSIASAEQNQALADLRQDIVRLSLEKLDRVRVAATQCRIQHLSFRMPIADVASVSTFEYFCAALQPLRSQKTTPGTHAALLQGCISCAGISAEGLLVAARSAVIDTLLQCGDDLLSTHMTTFTSILRGMLANSSNNTHAALELLAFLFEMQVLQRLADADFKWLNLLSVVQKSHHKSNDIPKILAAVHVYCGLLSIRKMKDEVLKKLLSMLRTNPYPRVRVAIAETLYFDVQISILKTTDWTKSGKDNAEAIAQMQGLMAQA
jgi:tubulin-specific chaperone D